MQTKSLVRLVGSLFISLFLMSALTSLADDKNEAKYEEAKSKCDKSPKTDCEEFEAEFKPKLNDWGTLLFKDLFLKGSYGFTNNTGTTGMFGQFGLSAEIRRTEKYGIGIAYKDKTILSNIMAFIQEPKKYTPFQDLVLDPFKLNADFSYGRELVTKDGLVTDTFTVKTIYNVEISYVLPMEKFVYYLGNYTGINLFRKKEEISR